MWALGCAIAVGAGGVQAATKPRVASVWTAEVTHVVDGDSIWVRTEDGGKRRKLRIEGIDAPEICQTQGPESRAAMRNLALGQRVQVTVRAYDRYGRGIATVRRASDNLDIAGAMVTKGWAWSDTFRSRPGKFAREEAAARGARQGLFAKPKPERPAEFRKRHGPCGAKAYS